MAKDYELTEFQVPANKKVVSQLRHYICFRMGLGKTVVTTKTVYEVEAKCILILCPKNAIRVWEDHFNEWIEGLDQKYGKDTEYAIHRYKGKYNHTEKRRDVFRKHIPGIVNIYITTFAAFISDIDVISKRRYDCVIIDEAKRIRSRTSKAFNLLKPIVKLCKWFIPLTGTPGKSPPDFFTIFHLMDPKLFSSYWAFVNTYCIVIKNEWGRQEIIGLRNREGWYRLLDAKCTILTKKDVGHRETVRQILRVDLNAEQERLYKELKEDDITLAVDNLIISQTSMTKVLRFRQLMCCPAILDPALGVGAAFEDYVETIKNDTDPFTVVFTPFTSAMPHFIKYLDANGFPDVQTLQGGLDPDEMQRRIDLWRKRGNQPIIVSILYATAFSLEPATESFFIGYEWDPEDNAQAEDRLNRLTTKELVNAYYYAYNGTYTAEHLQILTNKTRQERLTLGLERPTKI